MDNLYSSTVFLCETTEDSRYVRCDFKHCTKHSLNNYPDQIPVSYWLLNTPKNCHSIEKHVTQEIQHFVDGTGETSDPREEFQLNSHLLHNPKLLAPFTKILIVFNIRTPQSNYGNWINKFLELTLKGSSHYICVTLSFASRLEMLMKIRSFINVQWNSNAEIMVLLSCHSSTQGQVFSCTPVEISKRYGFEEFCSLHDFVCTCQDMFGSRLKITHISSCFTLKLNSSHTDWPVDSCWLNEKLECILSGSAKEVYETGSQTADLYLVSKVMSSSNSSKMRDVYLRTFKEVSYSLFPDLVREMGLCYLEKDVVRQMLGDEETEDQITHPKTINSLVNLVLVYDEYQSNSVLLKDAIVCNLKTRLLDFDHAVTNLDINDISLIDQVSPPIASSEKDTFFVVICSVHNPHSIIQEVVRWSKTHSNASIYGVHFNYLQEKFENLAFEDLAVSGFIIDNESFSDIFPVLLYMVHLALGEHGVIDQKDKGSLDTNTRNKEASFWKFEDVYRETESVLKGLCEKCRLVGSFNNSFGDRRNIVSDQSHGVTSLQTVTTDIGAVQNDTDPLDKQLDLPTAPTNNEGEQSIECLKIHYEENMKQIGNDQDQPNISDSLIANSCEEMIKDLENKPTTGFDTISDESKEPSKCITIEDEEQPDVLDSNLKDVPLMANVNEVIIEHYVLDLDVSFDDKCISGTEILFLKPANEDVGKNEFQMCLDCTLIDIVSVEEVVLPENFKPHFHQDTYCCNRENLNLVQNSKNEVSGYHSLIPTAAEDKMNEEFSRKDRTIVERASQTIEIPMSRDGRGKVESIDHDCQSTGIESSQSSHNNLFCSSCHILDGGNEQTNYRTKSLNYRTLPYAVYGWCIRVWNVETSRHHWPRCVVIKYKTKEIGPSLTWCKDQDGNDCCYTPGAFINNRSMMPCQEPPVAMATWQATITVPQGYIALSSGDVVQCKSNLLKGSSQGKDVFCFEMKIPLPSSTLAFAFGKFQRSSRVIQVPNCRREDDQFTVPVTLYAAGSKIGEFEEEYLDCAGRYLEKCCQVLGDYPFSRLDLVIMPRSFACMGLESPNMMFLSQSVLCGDRSMSTRIAHEISHVWFGLLVGAKDWTEEWLSEGFATYIEDRIVYLANKGSEESFSDDKTFDDYSGLMQLLRYKTLEGELEQTEDDNLKRLRPQRNRNYMTAIEAVNQNVQTNEDVVRPYETVPNAAIASKKFSQVHYLKGYFLLVHMAMKVGWDFFDQFLRSYLEKYNGSLVTSEMVFDHYAEYFSFERCLKDEFITKWLESPTIPNKKAVQNTSANLLVKEVEKEFAFWKKTNATNKRCRARGIKRRKNNQQLKDRISLNSNQLVLFLEKMLTVDNILPQTLTQLNLVYNMPKRNAEVRHRWCEMIIKEGCMNRHDEVQRFLVEDQGMGIYLFGELVIYNRGPQRKMAREIFDLLKNEMDKSTRETVLDLIE
eukprot:TCONS_00048996-protein